jgi:DNA polymerase phi
LLEGVVCSELQWQYAQVAGGKPSTQPARPGQLETFWATVVEGDLFTSSNERKYLGFQLFTILLPHLRCACAQCSPLWCKWRPF